MSSKQGFIKLYRQVQDHWIFQEKRKFSKFEAWVDMILTANHKDNKFLLGNELVEVERGQFITSIRKLGERWGWSNTKVSQFLDLLKSDEMIDYKKDTKKTVVTIVKYSDYHDSEIEKKTAIEHEKDANRTRKHTNKNVKNVKNDKEEIPYVEIVSYLNEKTGKSYRPTTEKTKSKIQARWNEGFVVDDFKKVIDIKAKEWMNNESMNKFLRPETLFGTKFEGYLNEHVISEGMPKKEVDPDAEVRKRIRDLKMELELGEEYFRKFQSIEEYESLKKELRELEQL